MASARHSDNDACLVKGTKGALFQVIEKGIQIMDPNLQEALFQAWQEYAKSIMKLYSDSKNINIYIGYLQFILSISTLTPYHKLKASLEYLMNITRNS